MLLHLRFWMMISLLLHVAGALILTLQFDLFKPEPPQILQVQLVSLPKGKPVEKPAPKPVEKIKTQASAAPKEPPKTMDKPKPKQTVEAPKVTLEKKADKKKEAPKTPLKPKEEKPKPAKKQQEEAKRRPPKLDKTPDKEKALRSKDPDAKTVAKVDDDFLKAMDFIDKLEQEDLKPAQEEEPEEETTLTLDDLKLADREDLLKIQKHIKKQWILPPGLRNADELSAVVALKAKEDGSLASYKIVESSGYPFFDTALMRAVRKAVPLPIPVGKYELFKSIELHFSGD